MKHQQLAQAWSAWWFRKVPPHSLAIFRICFSVYLLIVWGLRFQNFDALFTDQGFAIALFDLPSSPMFSGTLAIALMIVIVLMLIGCFFRLATIVAFIVTIYFWIIGVHLLVSTMDSIVFFLLFVLIFSGADRTFSVAMKWKHGSFRAWHPISVLPQRIIAVQISAMYLISGISKVFAPDWQNGLQLSHSLQSILGTRLAFWFVQKGWSTSTYDWLVYGVKVLEVGLAGGLWIPKLRWIFFVLGFLFHLSIALLLGLGWFLLLPGTYLLFLPPEAVHRFFVRRLGVSEHPKH